ncbi:MAG: hypothetical protein WC455_28250 [Dehalococcoidia bacterium]|jgi:hypothetical protein
MAYQGLSGKQYSSKEIRRRKGILFALCAGILIICLAVLLLAGCASPQPYPAKVGKAWCRHTALMAAAICGEFYPVRIVVGKTPGGGHAQAMCKIEGTWEWLQVRQGEVFVGVEEGPFVAERRDLEIRSYLDLMTVSYPIKGE